MITIDEIRVGDTADAWRSVGFSVNDDICHVGSVRIGLGAGGSGITGWSLRDIPDGTTDLDGVPTSASDSRPGQPAQHPNGVTRIDHIVLMTPDLARTLGALVAAGMEVRRERDAGAFTQAFIRLGDVILEVVGPKEAGPGTGPASLWGLTVVVEDIDATAQFLGDNTGRVKDAVQPGRRITTLRGQPLGISAAVAFMTERP